MSNALCCAGNLPSKVESAMIRRLPVCASLLSLFISAGVAVLWIRSFRANDDYRWNVPHARSFRFDFCELTFRDGLVRVEIDRTRLDTRRAYQLTVADWQNGMDTASPLVHTVFPPTPEPRSGSPLARLGFSVHCSHDHMADEDFFAFEWFGPPGQRHRHVVHHVGGYTNDTILVTVPMWPIAILFLIPGIVTIRAVRHGWRRRRRSRAGACVGCGYDLRGNMSGVCPECGSGVAQPKVATV